MAAPPPPELMDELVGEILLRLPPDEPEHLFRAALVCKPWLRIICDAAFLRRYRAFHGAPPLLGLLHRLQFHGRDPVPHFASTTSMPDFPHPGSDGRDTRPLDCRHGRVLIHMLDDESTDGDESTGYLVFDPITGDMHNLPAPDIEWLIYSAAVLCAADGCDHLDCHGSPFLVVFMATLEFEDNIVATVYSSEEGAWSVPVSFDDGCEAYVQHMRDGHALSPSYKPYLQPRRGTVVGDAIYFTIRQGNTIVKYEWGKNCLSMINPPPPNVYFIALMAMEDSSLGFACIQGSSLYTWSRKVDLGATEWVQGRAIELERIIPVVDPNRKPFVVGSAEGVGVIFVCTDAGLFTIELKPGRVRKVDLPGVYFSVLPYMSFYTPDHGRLLSLVREKSEKLIAVESYEKEKLERQLAESSREVLAVDLERGTHDAKWFSEQLQMVQDTNKRLQEYSTSLEQYNSNLQEHTMLLQQDWSCLQAYASKSEETILKLQKENSTMTREYYNSICNLLKSSKVFQQEAIRVKEEHRKEVESLRAELKQVRDDRDHSVAQLNSLNIELADFKEQVGKSSKECESMSTRVSTLEETCNAQQEQIQTFQKQLAVATQKLKLADVTAIEAMTGYEEQKEKIKYLEERLAHAESQIVEGDELRKKLHNTILELKGNIRVFCRVRPLLRFDSDTNNGSEGASISFPTSVESTGRAIDLVNQGQKLSFSYDKVFDPNASQEDVFVEISQLVQSALDGYKVCIFAYGQTGSGKTYTMMGRPGIDQKGIIPRSLEQIFKTSQSLESQGWEYSMQASMLEIYNETFRDLLAPGRPNS